MCVGGSCECHGGLIVVFNEFGGVFAPGVSLCVNVGPVLLCMVIGCMLAQHNILPTTVSVAVCFGHQQVKLACDGVCVRSELIVYDCALWWYSRSW